MMMKSVLCVVVALAGMLNAQDLLPELAVPAAKYKSALEALNKEKLDNITRAAQSYVAALNGVETSAATAGKTDVVAAVAKERESLASGALEPDLPAGLPPMRLRGSRQALLGKLTQINADHARRKKQLDGSYINALNALQEKASANPELAKQIAAEKNALLERNRTVENGMRSAKKSNAKNIAVNGDFEKIVAGYFDSWSQNSKLKVMEEKGNHFARFDESPLFDDGTCNRRVIEQTVEIPQNQECFAVSARLRTANVTALQFHPTKRFHQWPSVKCTFLAESQGAAIAGAVAEWGGKNGVWKDLRTEGRVPASARYLHITLSNETSAGQVDFDDIEVTFE